MITTFNGMLLNFASATNILIAILNFMQCSKQIYNTAETRGPWWLTWISLDLENQIQANMLTKMQDDYINKLHNVACLMDWKIEVKVKYRWLHSRCHAKMYACAKYHWL